MFTKKARSLCTLALGILSAIPASAQLGGAVFTTNSDGTAVQANLFTAKTLVYIDSPQNGNGGSALPDGTYYFQVTDPSGKVLLSADDVTCRQAVVSGGKFTGVPLGAAPGSCTSGSFHPVGTPNPSNGSLPVQLCPATSSARPDDHNPGWDANNWCDTTANPAGVYKVWITPTTPSASGQGYVGPNGTCTSGNNVFGFCDSDVKTKTFKVRSTTTSTPAAYITACKFNDVNGDGIQNNGEQPIVGWPITALNVDEESGPIGNVQAQTDETGCVVFSVSDFSNTATGGTGNGGVVTIFEGSMAGWQQTAPAVGTYTPADGNGGTVTVNVVSGTPPTAAASSNYFQTFTVAPGNNVTLPSFGNACVSASCGGLVVTKTASPSLKRTYTWGITKGVDTNTVYSVAGGTSNAANYTVSVTHDTGTDSNWQATGEITVSNSTFVDVTGVQVTDAVDNGGSCNVSYPTDSGGNALTSVTIPAATDIGKPSTLTLQYTCNYPSLPVAGTNTASVVSVENITLGQGTASVDFSKLTANGITTAHGTVNVSDSLEGSLGTVSYTDPSPKTFTYVLTFKDSKSGTCTSHPNTATYTVADNTTITGSDSKTVQDCQGADLTVTKTANATFASGIVKTGPASLVEVAGTSTTLNYTVTVTESGWQVAGNINVVNPNDWEDISGTVTEGLSGCTFPATTGNAFTVARSSSFNVPYVCTFSSVPAAATGNNTATAYWTASTYHTLDGQAATGIVPYSFASLAVYDTFNGGTPKLLGTISKPAASTVFPDGETVSNLPYGGCVAVSNTATIPGGSSTVSGNVCNTKTGALTMGFWKNPNGQGIITSGLYTLNASNAKVCNSGTWLRAYNPFQDLGTAATCSQVATYVANTIGAASCTSSTNTCNSMLKAQMLATALDVYFSDPSLGGNKIGPYTGLKNNPPLGSVIVDLAAIHPCTDGSTGATCTSTTEDTRPEFGISTSTAAPVCLGTTVANMLLYANYSSTAILNGNPVASPGGNPWYRQTKSLQVPAKDSFDDFNNQLAAIAPASCPSTY